MLWCYLYLYITWQYALLCYRATGVTYSKTCYHSWPYICAKYCMLWIFLGSHRMETAPTSIEVILRPTQSQSDEPSDLRGSLSPMSVYSTWQSQSVTHPIINRARRCLTSVIEHKPLSERRIPYLILVIIINI